MLYNYKVVTGYCVCVCVCVCACVRVHARNGGFVETCGDIPFNIIKIQSITTTDFFYHLI